MPLLNNRPVGPGSAVFLALVSVLAVGPFAFSEGEDEGEDGGDWEIGNPEGLGGDEAEFYLPHANIACDGAGEALESYSLKVRGDQTGQVIVQSVSGSVNSNYNWDSTLAAPGGADGWSDGGNGILLIQLWVDGGKRDEVSVYVAAVGD